MTRPLIAISGRPRQAGEVHGWPGSAATVMQNVYVRSLWRAGADEAIVAPREMTVEDAERYLSRMDGLVLVGGSDVDPARYGQDPHPKTYGVDAASDTLEAALVLAAIRLGLPTLCICRGLQVLNVACGGTLHQHITGSPGVQPHGQPGEGFASHSVRVASGTRLSQTQGGSTRIDACWSYHHQAIDRLGDGLLATAWSADGLVEAVELDRAREDGSPTGWLVAVQWHPERTAEDDPAHQALFDELARQATARRQSQFPHLDQTSEPESRQRRRSPKD